MKKAIGFLTAAFLAVTTMCFASNKHENADLASSNFAKPPHALTIGEGPDWFDKTQGTVFLTEQDLDTEWRSKKRCCENKDIVAANNEYFAKSCYLTSLREEIDPQILPKCLWLMFNAYESNQRIKLQEYYLEKYSNHDKTITSCANCDKGDITVRVASSLSYEYENYDLMKAIDVLETALNAREHDTSPWILVEVYTQLTSLYLKDTVSTPSSEGEIDNNTPLHNRGEKLEKIFQSFLETTDNKPVQRRLDAFEKVYYRYVEG